MSFGIFQCILHIFQPCDLIWWRLILHFLCKLWTAQIFLFHLVFHNHTCYIPILRVSKSLFDTPHILLNYHGIPTLLHPYILCINIQSVYSENIEKKLILSNICRTWIVEIYFVRQQEGQVGYSVGTKWVNQFMVFEIEFLFSTLLEAWWILEMTLFFENFGFRNTLFSEISTNI